jgi:ParB-like chromosome segregation protein Spo0J
MDTQQIDMPLERIAVEWDDYPRTDLDEERVLEFRELLRDPEVACPLPPIELVADPARPGIFRIADGFHRAHAHLDEGRPTVPAVVLPPETEVFLHAVRRAAIGPKPLTRTEKRSVTTRVLTEHPDWSNHRIAELVGVSRPFVAHLRTGGGNVAPTDEETKDDAPAKASQDLARKALRALVEAYAKGYGRTKLGFGSGVNPKAIRGYLERLDDEDYAGAVKALRAWAEALKDGHVRRPDVPHRTGVPQRPRRRQGFQELGRRAQGGGRHRQPGGTRQIAPRSVRQARPGLPRPVADAPLRSLAADRNPRPQPEQPVGADLARGGPQVRGLCVG